MYQTILVATDGSEASETAVEHAVALAESTGATLHALIVVDTSTGPLRFDVEDAVNIDEAVSDLAHDLATAYDHHAVDIEPDVRRGRPARTILDYAAEVDADLIVAGQRGENALKHVFLGSTTDRLARETEIPLVVVPDGEAKR
jgi:nucleotide-binding universal stress UspA family protein